MSSCWSFFLLFHTIKDRFLSIKQEFNCCQYYLFYDKLHPNISTSCSKYFSKTNFTNPLYHTIRNTNATNRRRYPSRHFKKQIEVTPIRLNNYFFNLFSSFPSQCKRFLLFAVTYNFKTR